MNSFYLFVVVAGVLFASASVRIKILNSNKSILIFQFIQKANEILVRQIRSCQKQFPKSESRTLPDFDLDLLTKDDKCYLNCIMTVQKVVSIKFKYSVISIPTYNIKLLKMIQKPFRFGMEDSMLMLWSLQSTIQRLPTNFANNVDQFDTQINVNMLPNYKNVLKL